MVMVWWMVVVMWGVSRTGGWRHGAIDDAVGEWMSGHGVLVVMMVVMVMVMDGTGLVFGSFGVRMMVMVMAGVDMLVGSESMTVSKDERTASGDDGENDDYACCVSSLER